MIYAISVVLFRGIVVGELEGLGALTLLTGPNGCGKSTILDALLIAASPKANEAVGRAVRRHPTTRNGARWLVGTPDGQEADPGSSPTTIRLSDDFGGTLIERRLSWSAGSDHATQDSGPGPCSEITIPTQGTTVFWADNSYAIVHYPAVLPIFPAEQTNGPLQEVRLVDLVSPEPLDKTYSEAVKQGRKKKALALLRDLVDDLEDLEILTEDDGRPALYVVTADKAVPAGLSGGGIQALLQLVLGLAASPGGLVLVEEPEAFQHPRSIRQGAKALLAAMRRGVQLVVTTHSLELIDAVVGQASAEDLEQVVLFNLALSGKGELKSSRLPGPEIKFARGTLENDLR